jgi:dienelactone hydrolase
MEREVTFASAGLTLVGVLHEPAADGPRPAVIDLHGFGGSCSGAGHPELARALERAGYVVLRFDFRGCGKSEGLRGSVSKHHQLAVLTIGQLLHRRAVRHHGVQQFARKESECQQIHGGLTGMTRGAPGRESEAPAPQINRHARAKAQRAVPLAEPTGQFQQG